MGNQKLVDGLYAPMTRSFLALFLVTLVAFSIKPPFSEGKKVFHTFHMTFMWLAMVNFFISAPKIGNWAEVGLQHFVGSAVGAAAGTGIIYAAFSTQDAHVPLNVPSWFALGMCTVGLAANITGWAYKIPQTGMLMVLSCSMIVFCNESPESATQFMISRIVGMFAGVLLSLVLAFLVYPKAATQEVLQNIAHALDGLSEVNQAAWSHCVKHAMEPMMQNERTTSSKSAAAFGEEGFLKLSAGICKDGHCSIAQAVVTAKMEAALMKVYQSMEAAEAAIPLTRKEFGVKLFNGFWVFVPLLPWSNRSSLPEDEITSLSWSIRKCARILWTVSLTFQEGLDEDMVEALKQHYPVGLMSKLKDDACDTFEDFVENFPEQDSVPDENLKNFKNNVETLFFVDDSFRNRVAQHMQKYKSRALQKGLKRAPTMVEMARTARNYQRTRTSHTRGFSFGRSTLPPGSIDEATAPLLANAIPDSDAPHEEDQYDLVNGLREGSGTTTTVAMEDLQRLEIGELKMFPDTAEGYVSMVRWYSFQFLLTEVYNDMEEVQRHLCSVLEKISNFGVKGLRRKSS